MIAVIHRGRQYFISVLIICLLFLSNITLVHAIDQDCLQDRYRFIQKMLDRFSRPFTLLAIGSDAAWYLHQVAHCYNSVCVLCCENQASSILTSCVENKLDNLIVLNRSLDLPNLKRLSECEHVDIVLALDCIPSYGHQWREALSALRDLSSMVIIEIPTKNIRAIDKQIKQFLDSKKPLVLRNERVTLYVLECAKKYMKRKTWLTPLIEQNTHVVVSSSRDKYLSKKIGWPENYYVKTLWIPGFNLLTFKMLDGIYPTKEMIKKNLREVADAAHDDWVINNMIIQGKRIKLIDYNDPNRKDAPESCRRFSEESYRAHCQLIDLDDPIKIEHFFWHTLIRLPISRQDWLAFYTVFLGRGSLVFEIGEPNSAMIDAYRFFKIDPVVCSVWPESSGVNLEELVNKHGYPHFCRLNFYPASDSIRTLNQIIPVISLKFSKAAYADLVACIFTLKQLGYDNYNFVARDIPIFGSPQWVSAQEILPQIERFIEKDHDQCNFWGFLYARK